MSWSKEDRKVFNSSEVLRNMERKILENYTKLAELQAYADVENLNKNMNPQAVQNAKNYAGAVNEVSKAVESLSSNNDDGEVVQQTPDQKETKVEGDGFSVTVNKNDAEDEANEEEAYFKDTIEELTSMANKAALSGNIKLAYKIERAIDELIEAQDENK